jgi:outer membrane protein assembly factor BamD (BamD/ComL family)
MKKLSLLTLAVCAILLAGCTQDQYSIERRYYRIQQAAAKIFQNPHATPPRALKRIVDTLNRFSQKYPKSNLGLDAQFSIARLYIATEEYDAARTQLNKIVSDNASLAPVCAEAVFITGNTYELQDKWLAALGQYKKVIQEYPRTPRGFNAPVYIAMYYKGKYQPERMNEALREAVAHYNALALQYPGTPMGLQSRLVEAQCYMELKEWTNAIETLRQVIAGYKERIGVDTLLLNIAAIYDRQLHDAAKAIETLQAVIKDYPKSRGIETARRMLEAIKKGTK